MTVKKKILLIDDEREILMVMAEFLEEEGYEVVKAHNGMKALEKFADFKPDLVLSDNMMPLMSGLEILDKFRAMPGFLTTPFIIMSAAPLRIKADAQQPTDYLRKPFDVDNILKLIKKYV